MDYCLHPEQRLRQKSQFDRVFKPRKRLFGQHFLAYYRKNELPHSRMGIIISKRNVRLSVVRNRIRRVLKEQFRHKQHQLPGVDIVIIAKKGCGQAENTELSRCIGHIMKKLKT